MLQSGCGVDVERDLAVLGYSDFVPRFLACRG